MDEQGRKRADYPTRVMPGTAFLLAFGVVGPPSWIAFGAITALAFRASDRTAILVGTVASVLASVPACYALLRRAQISGVSIDDEYVRIVRPLARMRTLHVREIRSVAVIRETVFPFGGTLTLALESALGEEIFLLLEDPNGAAEAIRARNDSVRVERRQLHGKERADV